MNAQTAPLTFPVQTPDVQVIDAGLMAWQATANPGLWLKTVREDQALGHFLGLIRFDPFTRSGLHQHQGVATSLVIDGGLTDYHGAVHLHEAGINVKGSTHDAMAYQQTVLVSRLEGPVTYPPASDISGVHAGSYHGVFRNPDPSVPPEINVPVDALAAEPTGVPGVLRQTIFDYQGTGTNRRMLQLALHAHSSLAFTAGALTEFWVRGGQLAVNGQGAHANCFITCPPGSAVEFDVPFGALLIAWAQGPASEVRVPGGVASAHNLFGF